MSIVSHPDTRGYDVWVMLWTRVEVVVVSLGKQKSPKLCFSELPIHFASLGGLENCTNQNPKLPEMLGHFG